MSLLPSIFLPDGSPTLRTSLLAALLSLGLAGELLACGREAAGPEPELATGAAAAGGSQQAEPEQPAAIEQAPAIEQAAPIEQAIRQPAVPEERDAAERLEHQLERMRALPWRDAWYARLDLLLDPPDARWGRVADAWFPGRAIRFQRDWNQLRDESGERGPTTSDFAAETHPYSIIYALHEQLAAHDIQLVVAPVPTRVQLYPELAFEEPPPGLDALDASFRGLDEGTARMLLELARAGVQVVDLLDPLAAIRHAEVPKGHSDQAFLRYNMHWTPHAARRAAEVVAARVRELENFAETRPGTLIEGRDFVRADVSGSWAPASSRNSPPDTVPEKLWIPEVRTAEGENIDCLSLASPILLLSDSYGTHFTQERSSFSEHLAASLEQRIDRIAIQGGGVKQTRFNAARREEHGVPSKRIVIWLFSVVMFVEDRDWVAVDFFE